MDDFPGREAQYELLSSILGNGYTSKPQPAPSLIHLYDPNTSPSTLNLLKSVITSPTVVVEVDPLVSPVPKALFECILEELGKVSPRAVLESAGDSVDVFLGLLSDWLEVTASIETRLVVIIKRAERLRDIWPEYITETLFHLAELSNAKGRVTLVTISILPSSQFRTTRGIGLNDAIVVTFPRLGKEDAIKTLSADANRLIKADNRHTTPHNQLVKVHSAFVAVAYDTFSSDIRDLEEIRLLACCVWYPFIEPLIQGVVEVSQMSMLFSRSSFLYRDALSRLHTREVTPQDWISQMVSRVQSNCKDGVPLDNPTEQPKRCGLVLPLIPSFLLLAAFLASYNPSRMDVRYFVRDESSLFPDGSRNGTSRKGRKRKAGRNGKGDSNLDRQEMLGPKMFPMDRLLSIFQSLMIEAGPDLEEWMGDETTQSKSEWWEEKGRSVAVMEGINHLVRIGALVRTASNEKIDNASLYRVNITREVALQLSHQTHFDLAEWLWDWES